MYPTAPCSARPLPVSGAFFGQGLGPLFMESVQCSGGESHVAFCPSSNFGHAACSHDRGAGVICQPGSTPLGSGGGGGGGGCDGGGGGGGGVCVCVCVCVC